VVLDGEGDTTLGDSGGDAAPATEGDGEVECLAARLLVEPQATATRATRAAAARRILLTMNGRR